MQHKKENTQDILPNFAEELQLPIDSLVMREMKTDFPKSVSVVISTYNNPNFLRLCLHSLCRQTRKPDEVIIADDGSTHETKETVSKFKNRLSIQHVWQEDKGFRKARIMNKAFAVCKGEYIIQIDGDIICDRHFVEDHLREAKPGLYLNGSRGKFTEAATRELTLKEQFVPHFYSSGLKRRLNTMRLPFLTPFFYCYKQKQKERDCNMSFWREDLYAVNGYDNEMVGYGSEDIDLPARLRRHGVRKRFIKFSAIEYHLYHKEEKSKKLINESTNYKRFTYYTKHNISRVKDGISRFR